MILFTQRQQNSGTISVSFYLYFLFLPHASQRWPCRSPPPLLFMPAPALSDGKNYLQGFSQQFRRLYFKRNTLLRSVCFSVIKKLGVHVVSMRIFDTIAGRERYSLRVSNTCVTELSYPYIVLVSTSDSTFLKCPRRWREYATIAWATTIPIFIAFCSPCDVRLKRTMVWKYWSASVRM